MHSNRLLVGALLASVGVTLAACGGGATVEDSGTNTSIAPLTREAKSSESTSAKSSASETTSAQDSGSASNGGGRVEEPFKDGAGQEITAKPTPGESFSAKEKAFLDSLTKSGVNIAGVENQMIGAAGVVCQGNSQSLSPATVQAVAGQLLEQQRSKLSFDELTKLIDSSARSAYC